LQHNRPIYDVIGYEHPVDNDWQSYASYSNA
jgi:hypothetical protein